MVAQEHPVLRELLVRQVHQVLPELVVAQVLLEHLVQVVLHGLLIYMLKLFLLMKKMEVI